MKIEEHIIYISEEDEAMATLHECKGYLGRNLLSNTVSNEALKEYISRFEDHLRKINENSEAAQHIKSVLPGLKDAVEIDDGITD